MLKKLLPSQTTNRQAATPFRRNRLRSGVLALLCIASFGLSSGLGSVALAQWIWPSPESSAPAAFSPQGANGGEPGWLNDASQPTWLSQATLPANVNPYDIAPPFESEVQPLDLDPVVPQAPNLLSPPPPPPRVMPTPRPAAAQSVSVPAPAPAPRPAPIGQAPAAPARPAADSGVGQDIPVTRPPANIKPSPEMAKPVPARPKFPALPRQEVRGVWMTTSDMEVMLDRDRLSDAMAKLARLNFNTVYPVVWNSGYALHPSQVTRRAGSPQIYRGVQDQDPLAEIVYQGHRNGISVMPWFEFGFMVPESSEIAMAHPDWLSVKADGGMTAPSAGGYNAWLNPLKPEVQKFITDLVMEVVNDYDVDGIQFDDHMALPRDFGYDSYTKALYLKETGKPVPANPADQAWMRWRADKITEFIGDLHDAVKTRKPRTVFSVSPNYQDFAYKFTLQDWLNWVRKDFVDEIVMQVYRDDYNSFIEQLERAEIKEVKQKISTAIGILSGLPRRQIAMGQVEQQSRAAQQRDLGVAYFFYDSLWDYAPETADERKQGFARLFPRPASRLAQLASF